MFFTVQRLAVSSSQSPSPPSALEPPSSLLKGLEFKRMSEFKETLRCHSVERF